MKVIINQDTLEFKKESFNELEKQKVPAELKRLEEVSTIYLTETEIKLHVRSCESNLYRILYRFARDFDIELV